jgi:2-polyprenyl-3-methyl-5-hydroxy-6-metoxy-1,4-benzoquinol methylase
MNPRTSYLLASSWKALRGRGTTCPSCGSESSSLVQRKYLVTTLRRCDRCRLQFRAPTTAADESARLYQHAYRQGFTTDCPGDDELKRLTDAGFRQSVRDYGTYLDVLGAAGARAGQRLFEFGCSWGYGSWQFVHRGGLDVEAYEISAPRADYARRKLGVQVHASLDAVQAGFDVFFSSHVLEHVPSVRASVQFGMSVLKPGGLFVAFVPNGSSSYRAADPGAWRRSWGAVHPQLIDPEALQHLFAPWRHVLASDPYDLGAIEAWRGGGAAAPQASVIGKLDGPELALLAVKPAQG